MEKPRVTEILARMDCNGCVHKIKKALQSVNGRVTEPNIYDVHIDLPQQELTIVGRAAPDEILKAIKKTRKAATIYSHFEIQEPDETVRPDGSPAQPEENAPPEESPQPQVEPSADQPPELVPPQQHKPLDAPQDQEEQPPPPPPPHLHDLEEVPVIHHYPPDHPNRYPYRSAPISRQAPLPAVPPIQGYAYGHQGHGENRASTPPDVRSRVHHYPSSDDPCSYGYASAPESRQAPLPRPAPVQGYSYGQNGAMTPKPGPYQTPEPVRSYSDMHSYGGDFGGHSGLRYRNNQLMTLPVYVAHSYNQYRPLPNVTQYEYVLSPTPVADHHSMDNHHYYENNWEYQSYQCDHTNGNGSMVSVFSDENPNACTIS